MCVRCGFLPFIIVDGSCPCTVGWRVHAHRRSQSHTGTLLSQLSCCSVHLCDMNALRQAAAAAASVCTWLLYAVLLRVAFNMHHAMLHAVLHALLCRAVLRSAERAAVMRQRVAAIEEREAQRRVRMEAMGRQAAAAGGPDMGAFMSQLENKGYGSQGQQQQAQGQQQQQQEQQPAGSSKAGPS